MNSRKLKIISVSFLIVFTMIISACMSNVPAKYQVKNKETGKTTDYYLNIVSIDEIGTERITEWFDKITNSDGFLYYVYSDPDSWETIIYLPNKQNLIANLNNGNITIDIVDSVLKVYYDAKNVKPDVNNKNETLIIHLKAPPRGAWPATIEVYWNDEKVACKGFDGNT